MSRLYDALRGTSDYFREGAEDSAGDGVLEALGIRGATVPQVLDDADLTVSDAQTRNVVQDFGGVLAEVEPGPPGQQHASVSVGIPVKARINGSARLIPNAMDRAVEEHYRRLRTKIMQLKEEKGLRSLVVASAGPQEGKTVTVINLGLSFAMLPSFKVLVVDGDTRRGTLGKWLGADDTLPGLSNLIDGSANLEEVVLKSDEVPMHFITRGNSRVADLNLSQLQCHFRKMTEHFDLVLVDSAPVNLVADVQLLAASCEAVLLVARAYSTTRKAYEKAVQELRPFQLIGTVLNAGIPDRSRYHGYY